MATTTHELDVIDCFDVLQAEWQLKKIGETNGLAIHVIGTVDHEKRERTLEITGATDDFWLTVNAIKFAREARQRARQ